jgi:hypothetical protein
MTGRLKSIDCVECCGTVAPLEHSEVESMSVVRSIGFVLVFVGMAALGWCAVLWLRGTDTRSAGAQVDIPLVLATTLGGVSLLSGVALFVALERHRPKPLV